MFIIHKILAQRKIRNNLNSARSRSAPARSATCPDLDVNSVKSSSSVTDRHSLLSHLTFAERRALRLSWLAIKKGRDVRRANVLMTAMFEKLFEAKNMHLLFVKASMDQPLAKNLGNEYEHGRLLANFLDHLITAQTNDIPAVAAIGAKHCTLRQAGFRGDMWEDFGMLFCETMAAQDDVRAIPNALRAWNKFSAALTDTLRAAYDKPKVLFDSGRKKGITRSVSPSLRIARAISENTRDVKHKFSLQPTKTSSHQTLAVTSKLSLPPSRIGTPDTPENLGVARSTLDISRRSSAGEGEGGSLLSVNTAADRRRMFASCHNIADILPAEPQSSISMSGCPRPMF